MALIEIARAIAALFLTLGLMFGLLYLARRFDLANRFKIAAIGIQNKKRLKIIESLWLDTGKTRLVLFDIDGVEKLVLVSSQGASEIELGSKSSEQRLAIIKKALSLSEILGAENVPN